MLFLIFAYIIDDLVQSRYSGTWSQNYKTFYILNSLSMKFSFLINMKMLTIVSIFIFIGREIFMFSNV